MQKQIIILLALIGLGLNVPAPAQTDSQVGDDHDEKGKATSFIAVIPTLSVTSVEKSIEYYTTVLGFTKNWDWPADEENKTFGSIQNGEVTVFLHENEQGARPVVVYYALKDVDDVDKLHEQYKAAGAKIKQPPTDQVWSTREMLVEDIDGHVMRIGAGIAQNHN